MQGWWDLCYRSLKDPKSQPLSKRMCKMVDVKLSVFALLGRDNVAFLHAKKKKKKPWLSAYFQFANTAIFLINTKAA